MTLEQLHNAIDWSAYEKNHEEWAEKHSGMLLSDADSRYLLRCVLLREAFYSPDADKRKGASIFLGPAYKQALGALREAGLVPQEQV